MVRMNEKVGGWKVGWDGHKVRAENEEEEEEEELFGGGGEEEDREEALEEEEEAALRSLGRRWRKEGEGGRVVE